MNSNETNQNLTAVEDIISKCGINQVDIEKSCGDGEIDNGTLNMLMGIFRYPDRMFLVNLFKNFSLRTLSLRSNFITCLFSGLMVLAFSICWLIKDASVKPLDEQFSILSLAQKTFRLIIEDKRQLFLIPLTIFSGNSLSFIADTFNFSFVTCGFGPQWIGAVMIAFGSRKAFDCLG